MSDPVRNAQIGITIFAILLWMLCLYIFDDTPDTSGMSYAEKLEFLDAYEEQEMDRKYKEFLTGVKAGHERDY